MINIHFDPTPRPVASYSELWGRDPKMLNAWCAKGWVPGAFKHPCGEWFVNPLELLGFDPAEAQPESRRPRRETVAKKPERLRYPGAGE
jgi:hypothetical protein